MAHKTIDMATIDPRAVIELLKPITWFAPMWALGCGVVSSGVAFDAVHWPMAIAGVLLAGPLVCGTSQAVNDWFDRHVDAINEPGRPIPSGRIPGRMGLHIAIAGTALSLTVASVLGALGVMVAVIGLALAWAYSAPPFRLKNDGWWGNAAVALSYEGLAWFTGALIMIGAMPDAKIVTLALLYSAGAHGIMTFNDFKSIDGDRMMGVRTLPVQLGARRAALLACAVMAAPQLVVVALLLLWGAPVHAAVVGLSVLIQLFLMRRLLDDPRARAPWYNATGVTLYVLGMLAAALAVRSLLGGAL